MRIKKVKITKEDRVSISFEKRNKKQEYDEYSMTCSEKAAPSFYSRLNDLRRHVVDMCELPLNYLDRITVRGASFSYGGDTATMGATIISRMQLKDSITDINLNTPHKTEEYYNDSENGDPMTLLSGDCVNDLIEVQEQCIKYINGEREQGDLFKEATG